MKKKAFIFGVPFLALALFMLPTVSKALIVSFPVIELSADPGTQVTKEVSLQNETDAPITFYSSINNFKASGTDGKPDLTPTPKEGEVDLASWISVVPGPITLQPKESTTTQITINVPVKADPGGHYAAVLWGSEVPGQKNENVAVSWKVGHLILLKVSGQIKEAGELKSFSLRGGETFLAHLPVDFVTEFQNKGNVHLKPIGQIEIKNMFGKQSALVTFNVKGGNVLPNSSRIFKDDSWTKSNPDSNEGFSELGREWNNFAFGRYTADLNLIFGSNQQGVVTTISFWVFPWLIIIIGLIIILVAGYGIFIGIKSYNAWVIKQASKGRKSKK